jgi:hypothetical protein
LDIINQWRSGGGTECKWIAGSSGAHHQRHHQKIIFPVALVDPVGKISEERHMLSLLKINKSSLYAFIPITFIKKILFPVPTRLLCLFVSFCLFACQGRTKTMSFYYWDPAFALDSMEGNTLRDNDVHTLYIRYFDVDWTPADSNPVPGAIFNFRTSPANYTVIPVVCIRNRVFEKLASASIPAFTDDIYSRVRHINESRGISNQEIQFDCDWTEKTKQNYFAFLSEYHRISVQTISSAIRMFQLRYPDKAGIPPVDYGVLFYFNLAETDSGNEKSVYERANAHHYTPSLRSYPLTLDVALPLFSAGRDAHSGEDLFEIVTDINRHSNHHIRNLIFFDLDRQNLSRYDPNVFRETLARFD